MKIYGDKIVKKFCKLNHIGIRNPIIEKKKKKKIFRYIGNLYGDRSPIPILKAVAYMDEKL